MRAGKLCQVRMSAGQFADQRIVLRFRSLAAVLEGSSNQLFPFRLVEIGEKMRGEDIGKAGDQSLCLLKVSELMGSGGHHAEK